MLPIIHYVLFMAGNSAISMMMTLFLKHYSDATTSEIGFLLLVLPFVQFFAKPIFCAMADRHQAYRQYLIGALTFMLLGYGSFIILPYFPDFVKDNGRTCWYILIMLSVIGNSSFGCAWSMGDTLAINLCRRRGVSFGIYRLWGSASWGFFGLVMSSIDAGLPGLVPPLVPGFLVLASCLSLEIVIMMFWPRADDFVLGDLPEDLPQQLDQEAGPIELPPIAKRFVSNALKFGSMSSSRGSHAGVSGIIPFDSMDKKSRASRSSKHSFSGSGSLADRSKKADQDSGHQQEQDLEKVLPLEAKSLQWTIFKLIVKRNRSFFKYFFIFILFGALLNVNLMYILLHVERLTKNTDTSFQLASGGCVVGQALGAIGSFVVARPVVTYLGRTWSICMCLTVFTLRFAFNGLALMHVSPYWSIVLELIDGSVFGIAYHIVSETGQKFAFRADTLIPELFEIGVLAPGEDTSAIRSSVQATMQGIFGGAFDGLGSGLGALLGGLILENHLHEVLWLACSMISFIGVLTFISIDMFVKCRKLRQQTVEPDLGK